MKKLYVSETQQQKKTTNDQTVNQKDITKEHENQTTQNQYKTHKYASTHDTIVNTKLIGVQHTIQPTFSFKVISLILT